MPSTNRKQIEDLLNGVIFHGAVPGNLSPLPLVSTNYNVSISGGLAMVEETRQFRNSGSASIEATITFPLPVHAMLYSLEAQIGEAKIIGQAVPNTAARDEYEDHLEQGKATILHEEVLRGVHKLSIGHLPPKSDISVVTKWVMALSKVGDEVWLRIPTTVGDVYGRSPLLECDDLVHDDIVLKGTLSVETDSGEVYVGGQRHQNTQETISLDKPIDIQVRGWKFRSLATLDADGSPVTLEIKPAKSSPAALNAAILVDCSGSMDEPCASNPCLESKHDAVREALLSVSECMRSDDAIAFGEFNDVAVIHSRATGPMAFREIVSRIGPADGGTRIGSALIHAIQTQSEIDDILLITDGKSYDLDVQELVRSGKRFSAVLVGEDSVEANIGHLAALSGGSVFIAVSSDVAGAVSEAIESLRSDRPFTPGTQGSSNRMRVVRNGMDIAAQWDRHGSEDKTSRNPAISAFVASLLLPTLDEQDAVELAQREGLVCHLTSLLLVDESGVVHCGLPATRKIPLMTPATQVAHRASSVRDAGLSWDDEEPRVSFSDIKDSIDWGRVDPSDASDSLCKMLPDFATRFSDAETDEDVECLAEDIGISPTKLVVYMLARTRSEVDGDAFHVAQAILKLIPVGTDRRIEELASELGLPRAKGIQTAEPAADVTLHQLDRAD